MSEDTRRGLSQAAQQGYWVSARVPYEYRKVEVTDGSRRRLKLEIDPETADVVRTIYDRAGHGTAAQTIATELNDKGVVSPLGGAWKASQVLRIQSDLVNTGKVVVGKNAAEPVEVRDAHPAIVSEAVFEKVKELLKQGETE